MAKCMSRVSRCCLQVLDARDPLGTRCRHLEHHLKKNARHKHLLLLLNKCDLVRPRLPCPLLDFLTSNRLPFQWHLQLLRSSNFLSYCCSRSMNPLSPVCEICQRHAGLQNQKPGPRPTGTVGCQHLLLKLWLHLHHHQLQSVRSGLAGCM